MPKADTPPTAERPMPLFVEVGKNHIRTRLMSVQFRRALKSAAHSCVEKHRELCQSVRPLPPSSVIEIPTHQVYLRALLYVLAMKIDGHCDTIKQQGWISQLELESINDQLTPWGRIRSYCISHNACIDQKNRVRLARVSEPSTLCRTPLLRDAIGDLVADIELQDSLSRLELDLEEPAPWCPPHEGAMMRPPIPWHCSDPDLVLARDKAFFGHSSLHPTQLHNVAVFGGTGSGKTESVIKPFLGAMLDYKLHNGTPAAMLVIDPKREMIKKIRDTLAQKDELDRLVVIGDAPPIQLFTKNCPLSISDRFGKLTAFAPTDIPNGDLAYWKNLGDAMVLDFLQLEDEFARHSNGQRLSSLMAKKLQLSLAQEAGFWPKLQAVLAYSTLNRNHLKEADKLLRQLCETANINSGSTTVMEVYTGDDDLFRQWAYSVQSARPLLKALANPDVARFVDLDILSDGKCITTNVADLIKQGKVILFCPEHKEGHRIAAKALKQKFYEAVFARSDLEQPIFVVMDEAHRFITKDAETGEQNFLDCCRAYRVVVVMATQSIASLKHALGSNAAAQTAVDLLCINLPTRFVFRSIDADTVAWLRTQMPTPSDGSPSVIDVRRPSNLSPGECYFLLADGTWGRRRARLSALA